MFAMVLVLVVRLADLLIEGQRKRTTLFGSISVSIVPALYI